MLGAPTEDQVDIGSSIAGDPNANTEREKYVGGDAYVEALSKGETQRAGRFGGVGAGRVASAVGADDTAAATRATTMPLETTHVVRVQDGGRAGCGGVGVHFMTPKRLGTPGR